MTQTLFEIVVKTDTDFTLRMGGDCQPGLGFDALLPQIDVFLGTRVDNFDIRPLAGTRTDDCCDNHERVIVCWIPETFLLGPSIGGEIELDGIRWKGERQEEEEEREPEETRHGEFEETNDHMRLPETRRAQQQNLQLSGNLGYARQNEQNPGVLCRAVNKMWSLQAGTRPPQSSLRPVLPIARREHTCYVSLVNSSTLNASPSSSQPRTNSPPANRSTARYQKRVCLPFQPQTFSENSD